MRFALLLVIAACNSDGKPADPTPTTPPPAPPASAAKPVEDPGKALAGKPTARVDIEAMGVSIEVPEGTTLTPPRDPGSAKRNANLKNGAFMVNVFAVDEYSTPSFAKAKEVYKDDKLVAWIQAEETATGWITFKEVVSSLHKGTRFEVDVRTKVGSTRWDCGVSAPTRGLGELALAACQTLSAGGETPALQAPRAHRVGRAAKAAVTAEKPEAPTVGGSLPREVIARVMRAYTPRIRSCYEQALASNPTLAVKVTTSFVIGADGKVTAAEASGADRSLTACVASVVKSATFPAPSGGSVRVSYPFSFSPS